MLLIGSHALKFNIPNFAQGQKNRLLDFDIISTFEEFDTWVKGGQSIKECYPIDSGKKMIVKTEQFIFEFEIAWEGSSAEKILNMVHATGQFNRIDSFPYDRNYNVFVPDLNMLLLLKMSHRYLKNSPHFLKTMQDIKFLKQHGAKITEELKPLLKIREKETYTYKHPNLNQNKSGFFNPNEGVKYVYDHDSIHVAMAHLGKPAYEYYKGDSAEVQCDKNKFFQADEMIRLYGVLEESYVLALERSQVPFRGQVTPKVSFLKAVEKVCTSITSGWFREYAYDNYDKIVSLYDEDYTNKFWNAVQQGIVKPYQKENSIY
jgi:hypothetical protein